MPEIYVARKADLPPNTTNKPNANTIRVDSDDDKLKFGTGASGTTEVVVVTESQSATLTNKTLTSPTINGATLATATLTSPTVNGLLAGSAIQAKASTAAFDVDSGTTGTTLTDITGLTGFTLEASATYRFRIACSLITQTANCGSKLAFKLTTATLTAVNARVQQSTDTDNSGAVSTSFTTTTDQAPMFAQNAVVYTNFRVDGTLTVGTAGTVAIQCAQNAAHADNTTIVAGAIYAEFIRVL